MGKVAKKYTAMIKNKDDEELRQKIKDVDKQLKRNETKEEKDTVLDRYKQKLIEELQTPNTLLMGLDGNTRPAKIKWEDWNVEIKQEGEEEIRGEYIYSPNQKYMAVIVGDYYLVMPDGIHEKFIKGKVYLLEGQRKLCWCQEFYSPEKVFVNNSGRALIEDSLCTCTTNKGCVSSISLINIEGRKEFNYIFRSNLAKVLFSSKRNELICLTLAPDSSFYFFKVPSQKLIHKAKLQRKFKSWFLSNVDYSFKEEHIKVWEEGLFERIREKILEEKDSKGLPENKRLLFEDLKFRPDSFTEEHEHEQFRAIYSKPEFKGFEYYIDYFSAMGVTELKQLLSTDISGLIKQADNKFFRPGPCKIYKLNDTIFKKFGQELKGIEEYIPVSRKARTVLAKIGIRKLSDCSNCPADKLLSVRGVGNKTLVRINSVLQKYHHRTIGGSAEISEKVRKSESVEQTHIFDQDFPTIFEQYKNKKGIREWEKKGLATLEQYLLKPDYKNELFSGVAAPPAKQAAEMARKFRNYGKTQIFKKALGRYASKELNLQGVGGYTSKGVGICTYSDFWREYRSELKSILDSIIKPINNKGCFGKFNPYLVYMLLFSSEHRGASCVHTTFFESLSHFFHCKNRLARKMYGDDPLYEMDAVIDSTGREVPVIVARGERGLGKGKTYIKDSLRKVLESSSDFIIFTDPHTNSFVQLGVEDRGFLLDFPVAPGNNNYGKLPELEKLLLSSSFKKAAGKAVSDLEVKEFVDRYEDGLEVMGAMCGGDLDFIADLTDKIFKKVHKLPNDYMLEIELG